jgi:hypothetical protein
MLEHHGWSLGDGLAYLSSFRIGFFAEVGHMLAGPVGDAGEGEGAV